MSLRPRIVVALFSAFGLMGGGLLARQEPRKPAEEAKAETAGDASKAKEKTDARRPIRAEDYGRWESLGAPSLSADGRWLAYGVSRVDEESALKLRMLATDATESFPQGTGAKFSKDSRWLGFLAGPSPAEREKLEKAKETPKTTLHVRDLVKGGKAEVENVSSFAFSDDGRYLAIRRPVAKGREGGGDLLVRDLETGLDTHFGNVSSFAFNDDGPLLALIVATEDKVGDGVRVYNAATGVLRTLDSAKARYTNLTWRKKSADLAALREVDHAKDEDASYHVLAWRGLDQPQPRASTFDRDKAKGFPDSDRVVDHAGLRWADNGSSLFFGIKPWENRPKPKKTDEPKKDEPKKEDAKKDDLKKDEAKKTSLKDTLKEPSGVEIWHAKDVDIIPYQKKNAERTKRESFLSAWWLDDDRFVPLANDLTEDVRLVEGQKHALGTDNTPHEALKKFGPTLSDVYAIDAKTGDRRKILDRVKYLLTTSPDGRSFLYARGNHLWAYDLTTGRDANLTANLGVPFINQELTVLTEEKPPYGLAGWSKDGKDVYLYDRYDIWKLAADGSGSAKLTDGRADKVVHRRWVVGDREEERFIDPAKPMIVSLVGEESKESGYGRLAAGGKVERLIWKPKGVGSLIRAEKADVFAFEEEDFDDSPDLFVAGSDLRDPRRVSDTNPFQKDFLWGRSELVSYKNGRGEPLQGILSYPADYEPGKTYPMIVYIYEKLSDSLHGYSVPSERSPYNPSVFTAEGYFVLRPDIVYQAQNPGLSAVDCIVPAVKAVLETGKVDRARVGLVGHSWGAYQTAFVVTQTDVFAAGIAGAPLTNMMSMSMSIYWNSGQTDAWIFHESQGRMNRPFWRDVDTYIKNSPIFQIDNLKTPLLVAFGDQDGAVDWHQGIEMYNAARLAGKPMVLLVYPGENHGLAQKPNQVDYHYRILDWFGHYLKGQDAPKWITEGQKHLDRQKEVEKLKKATGKAESKPAN